MEQGPISRKIGFTEPAININPVRLASPFATAFTLGWNHLHFEPKERRE